MNQKGFANIVLVLVSIVLAGAVGYFAFVKKSEPTTTPPSSTPTSPTTQTSNDQPTPAPHSGKTVIQKLALDDGSHIFLVSSKLTSESSKLNKIFNCKLPDIETVNASLEYEGRTTALGFIGIPKKINGNFPVIENITNYGLENLVKSLEWSPLQKLVRGFGVIDYSAVKSVDPRSKVNLEKPGYEGAAQTALAACYLDYKMLFFEVDTTTKTIKLMDTGTGIHFYEDLERFKKEITPGCSPFGCG